MPVPLTLADMLPFLEPQPEPDLGPGPKHLDHTLSPDPRPRQTPGPCGPHGFTSDAFPKGWQDPWPSPRGPQPGGRGCVSRGLSEAAACRDGLEKQFEGGHAGWRNPPIALCSQSQLGRSPGAPSPHVPLHLPHSTPRGGWGASARAQSGGGVDAGTPHLNPHVQSQACGVQWRGQGCPLQKAQVGSDLMTGSGEACGGQCQDEGQQVWAGGQARTQAGKE